MRFPISDQYQPWPYLTSFSHNTAVTHRWTDGRTTDDVQTKSHQTKGHQGDFSIEFFFQKSAHSFKNIT